MTRLLRETDLQAQIIEGLRWHGYEVQTTQEKRRRCSACGEYSHRGTGVTQGIADLLVRHPDWPCGLWGQIEVKTPGGRLSREQATSSLFVARSLEDALMSCRWWDGYFAAREVML